MILVTVGSNEHQFNRLIKEIDELKERKILKEEIIAQIGNSTYFPKNFDYFKFKPYEEMENLTRKSDIVISHAGAGSIMLALEMKKPLIVVPRMKKYGEHINDHQVEITRQLEKEGKLIGVYEIEKIMPAIIKARKIKKLKSIKQTKIIEILNKFVKRLEVE